MPDLRKPFFKKHPQLEMSFHTRLNNYAPQDKSSIGNYIDLTMRFLILWSFNRGANDAQGDQGREGYREKSGSRTPHERYKEDAAENEVSRLRACATSRAMPSRPA